MWAFDAGLCKAHLKPADKPAGAGHPAQFKLMAAAAAEPHVLGGAVKSSPPYGNSAPLQASKSHVSSVGSQKSSVESAPLQASAGGGAASSLSEAVDTVPSAFDISVTSVSSLQNWLISIPDLPLREALELLRPHCPGLSVAVLADLIEANDFEVANITVRDACPSLYFCNILLPPLYCCNTLLMCRVSWIKS
jgi:hypothetical protein